ncbi:MAG: thiamine pyrophosphate-binding protein [Gammaproteobacteria bacterium]|nr:thiamine pyrophosphate-binding protein [Gammaproteobacteria bacterium]MCY4340491.1 thiamine pyrophosphate-binding protein [Gammaproteobacteria bacterium]
MRIDALKMTGGEALMRSVLAHGIDTVFGLPGGQTYGLFDALARHQRPVEVINSRHEQGAAYMALGYAASTGRPGVFSVVPGPGVLNAGSALVTAYATNSRVLCLAGQVPSRHINQGWGMLHEIHDQLGILKRLTKWAERIPNGSDAPEMVAEAFRQLHTGRALPVALEMPPDVMEGDCEATLLEPASSYEANKPDPDALKEAARILGAARNPVIIAGPGALDAGAELMRVAEMLQAPAAASFNAKGVIDERHYLGINLPVAHALWSKADAVLAVGTRFAEPELEWGLDDGLAVVRLEADDSAFKRGRAPSVALRADAGAGLTGLAEALESVNRKRDSRKKELLGLKRRFHREFARNNAPQVATLEVVREELPEDGFLVDEVTQMAYTSWFAFPSYRARHFISSNFQGNLGYGYPTALGVQAAHRDRKVVAFAGDGGFLYAGAEMATAARHGLNVVVIVFSNDAYGNVRRDQAQRYSGRTLASGLTNPDFKAMAESFGLGAWRARTPEALRVALREALAANAPGLIEMPVSEMPSPWPYLLLPRVR